MGTAGVKHIEEYFRRYWRRIEEAKSFVPPEYLPEFLRSTIGRIVIFDCRNGYLTLIYQGVGDIKTSVFTTTRKVQDVFESQRFQDGSGNRAPRNLRFGVSIKGSASIHIAEPKLILGDPSRPQKVFYPPWLMAHILVEQEPSIALASDPASQAEKDVQTFVFARRLQVEKSANIEETRERVIINLEDLLKRFRVLLVDASREEELQVFIKENTFLLAPFSQQENVYPKYSLGKEYTADFVIENNPPLPFTHTFIEIEPPSEPLFLKGKGHETELTARANHGIEQLRNWRIWVRDNIAYIRRDFSSLDQCNYILIMGRGGGLSGMQKRKLAELNAEHNWRMILTYDDLADKLEQLIANLKKLDKSGC